jgi:uncharacterized protein YdeI (YjbR/CyaY-like superfamily)
VTPRFFVSPARFRAWLEARHATETELWVGFHRKSARRPSLTWPESVDEALCFGWIDGLRRRVDESSYAIRFTPRKPKSNWSAVNLRRMEELIAAGRVAPAGLAAYARRDEERSRVYSYDRRQKVELGTELERLFRARRRAWDYFSRQPQGYRRLVIHWVASAKREETRRRRLDQLIECSAAEQRLPQLARTPRNGG